MHTSSSVSEYRESCRNLVNRALERPDMYFSTLREFEFFMAGHADAFQQLFEIQETFTFLFSVWVYTKKGLSGSAGWARAINKQAKRTGELPINVFRTFVVEFFEDWNNEAL